ncbi:hypothetical protein CPB83DRAFT_897680, partial [Crepidotus variabilis]
MHPTEEFEDLVLSFGDDVTHTLQPHPSSSPTGPPSQHKTQILCEPSLSTSMDAVDAQAFPSLNFGDGVTDMSAAASSMSGNIQMQHDDPMDNSFSTNILQTQSRGHIALETHPLRPEHSTHGSESLLSPQPKLDFGVLSTQESVLDVGSNESSQLSNIDFGTVSTKGFVVKPAATSPPTFMRTQPVQMSSVELDFGFSSQERPGLDFGMSLTQPEKLIEGSSRRQPEPEFGLNLAHAPDLDFGMIMTQIPELSPVCPGGQPELGFAMNLTPPHELDF